MTPRLYNGLRVGSRVSVRLSYIGWQTGTVKRELGDGFKMLALDADPETPLCIHACMSERMKAIIE